MNRAAKVMGLTVLALLVTGCLSDSGELDFRPLTTATPTPPAVVPTAWTTATPTLLANVQASASPAAALDVLLPTATPPCQTDTCWLDLAKTRGEPSLCAKIDTANKADYLDCYWTMAYRLQDERACEGMVAFGAECVALAHRNAGECESIKDRVRKENCVELFKVIQEVQVQ